MSGITVLHVEALRAAAKTFEEFAEKRREGEAFPAFRYADKTRTKPGHVPFCELFLREYDAIRAIVQLLCSPLLGQQDSPARVVYEI